MTRPSLLETMAFLDMKPDPALIHWCVGKLLRARAIFETLSRNTMCTETRQQIDHWLTEVADDGYKK